jgi:hypothetical protein
MRNMVGKAEELECLGPFQPILVATLGRLAAKAQDSGLLGCQFQVIRRKALGQRTVKRFGILASLEAADEIIRIADAVRLAATARLEVLFEPLGPAHSEGRCWRGRVKSPLRQWCKKGRFPAPPIVSSTRKTTFTRS